MAERSGFSDNGRSRYRRAGNGGDGNGNGVNFSALSAYVPPQDLKAEQSTLGAMLIERAAIEKAAEILDRDDFYRDAHQTLFEVIVGLTERDEPADFITVGSELKNRDKLEAIGGESYLAALIDSLPTAANIEYYAKIVHEKALLRRLIEAALEIVGLARGEVDEVSEVLDRAEQLIFSVSQQQTAEYFAQLRTLLLSVYDKAEELGELKQRISGLSTGIHDFDMITSGLQNTDLIIVAARPSMGKCVKYDTLIDDPSTGERITAEDWVRRRLPTVFGFSDNGQIHPASVGAWIDSGVKPCYRVRTCTGRVVEVTGHHPFLTVQGWTPLHDLTVGAKIAVPRVVPAFGSDESMPLGLVRLLAYFIAEGGLMGTSPAWTNTDPVLIADFQSVVVRHFPECAFRKDRITYFVRRPRGQKWNGHPNPVNQWLTQFGLRGKLAEDKFFPDCVWQWSKPHLAEFLRVLMSCDGTIYALGGYPRIEFAVASEKLAQDVHHAFTRFGIVSKLWRKSPRCWRVEITEPQSVAAYQEQIGWVGEKSTRFAGDFKVGRRSNTGHAPQAIWELVRKAAAQQGLPLVELARRAGETTRTGKYAGYNLHAKRGLPQKRLVAYAEVLNDPALRRVASPDLYWDEIVSIESIGEHQVYDLSVPDGANFIAQDICVHNTSLCLSIAEHVALKENKTVALFSLEMSKEQLALRMLCSQALVNSHKLRTGHLSEDEWTKLALVVQNMYEAPIFIDDATDSNALTMRAKCRRLMAEHGLGLIVVDYLQLMRSHRRTENRVQEIGEIARGLKSLARELKVPVIALSQLSRSVETRENKRPMLSDLRECVVGNTHLADAETGCQVSIRDVKPGDRVLGLGPHQKIGAYEVADVWSTGVKPVFTLTTRTGRQVTATANHPLLTAQGWKRLEELAPGDIIATSMRLPEYGQEKPERAERCRLLGYLVGDGTFQTHRAVGFCGSDPVVVQDAIGIVTRQFSGVNWREKKSYGDYQEGDFSCLYANGFGKPYGNPLREWLRELGVLGQKDSTKRVPDWVWEAGTVGAREFLAGYLSSDGCVKHVQGRGWFVHFDTVSRRLAEDVQMLLLRLGVIATVNDGSRSAKSTQPIFRVQVLTIAENIARFCAQVRPSGRKGVLMERLTQELAQTVTNGSLLTLPPELSELMFEKSKHLRQQGRKLAVGPRLYWKPQGKRPRRDVCARFAEQLKDEILSVWANSDLLWEEIKRIEPAGEEEVFDISIPGCANFLANGIVAHNSGSIEAEADMVCFLYREAYYKMKEAYSVDATDRPERAEVEETEIIVGKHRNGPTGMVKVGFMAEYAKFVDMELRRDDEPTGF